MSELESASTVEQNPKSVEEPSLESDFVVQFWGVRGSIPSPGSETVRYGGNTSCVEMRIGGKRLIFDGGTGLRMLGKSLLSEMPVEAYMFFTHSHWDHIQGFPFFVPAFAKGNCFHIYGAIAPNGDSMEKRLLSHLWRRVAQRRNHEAASQRSNASSQFSGADAGDAV